MRSRSSKWWLPIALLATAAACKSSLDSIPPGNQGEAFTTTTIAPVAYDALYVVNAESSSISVVNTETNQVTGTIELRGITYPHRVSLSPDRSLLGVAIPGYDMSHGEHGHEHHSSREGYVALLDATTGALRATTKTNAANNNVVFAPGGRVVWTSQATQPGSTLVLDVDSLEINDAIKVETSPAQTIIDPAGVNVFVANAGSSSVSVIDAASRRVKARIPVGNGPVLAQPSPDGFVYVENEADKSISVIDASTFRVLRAFALGYVPGALATPAADEVWITNPERGALELRRGNGDVVGSVITGRGAHFICFSADLSRVFVSNTWENTVSIVDRNAMTVVATIPVGSSPNGLAWRAR